MNLRIRNWKLLLLGLIGVCCLASLGFWQLSRAEQKKILLKSFAERTARTPFTLTELNSQHDLRFYRTTLRGHFDNQHSFLLDNKIRKGVVGYEVYTRFWVDGSTTPFLVDRGFIPMGNSRQSLPRIRERQDTQTITGMLNRAPAYVAFGKITEAQTLSWPLRLEFINFNEINKLVASHGPAFFPYVIMLDPRDPAAYQTEWEIVAIGPERHQGYAVQWFALALTLLILSVVLNRAPKKDANPRAD